MPRRLSRFLWGGGKTRISRIDTDSIFGLAVMKSFLVPLLLVGALPWVGCARFEPRPISAADTAAKLEGRSLANPALKPLLEKGLKRELNEWPAAKWDFEMLT